MTAAADPQALMALITTARGQRPQSLASAEAEDVLNVALALLVELVVTNDRVDRLERMMAEQRGEPIATLRAVAYDGDEAADRRAATDALLTRALRIFLDPRTQAD